MKTLRRLLLVSLLALFAPHAHAILLNWDTVNGTAADWVNGALTGSFEVDASNPGNDITITITRINGDTFTTAFPQTVQNGPSVIANNDQVYLQLRTDGMVDSTRAFQVTITFNGYANGVYASTALSDIDQQSGGTGWVDLISNISGQTAGGTTVPLTVVGSTHAVVAGTGLGVTVTGTGGNITDHTGDASFSSGSTLVTSITFTWSNPGPNFGGQVIALHDIFYTTTPEVGSSLGALLLCGSLAGFSRWRRTPAVGCA